MSHDFFQFLTQELHQLRSSGLGKAERVLTTPQGPVVRTLDGRELINLCANNYLGLSSHPAVIDGARRALERYGFGLSSVRFICGTQDQHKTLERRLSKFLGTDDTILYAAAFDANGGLFEPLLGAEDAILSDELNHASIIDGIRLCKAKRYRYKHDDPDDLERALGEAGRQGARFKLVMTDGVFSMDGTVAQLDRLRQICDRHGALLGVDECHATGFVGRTGRGTHEYRGIFGKVDIITGTLGKALGGASGGFTSGRQEIIDLLRERSRPYLFSNSLAPPIVGASLAALDLVEASTALRDKLEKNTHHFRSALGEAGFSLPPGEHPIVPVMLGEPSLAKSMAARLYESGVHVVAFCYPVVPHGKARVRVQLSAAHEPAHLEHAARAFKQAGEALGILS